MEDSCQDRQENEKAALKAIYNEQMIEICNSDCDWQPLECILTLGPQGSIGPPQQKTPRVDLHVTCSNSYPDMPPKIFIENCKGLSNENRNILLKELQEMTSLLKGEVMVFELAQHVEKFLHLHNKPGYESFYEEMTIRLRRQQEQEMLRKQADEDKKREELILEIQNRQQAVKAQKKALRRRRSSARSDDASEIRDNLKTASNDKSEQHFVSGDKGSGENTDQTEDPSHELYQDYTPWNISAKGQSRYENEFEHIKWLGKGAFGDVLKVRNKLDDGLYAIKRIQLNPMNKMLNKKITREVKLLSRLNHENVVRYYNSWIETSMETLPTLESRDEVDKSDTINSLVVAMLPRKEPSLDWNTRPGESSEESSDDDECWITFKSGSITDGNDDISPSSNITMSQYSQSSTTLEFMYIQMELCEKSTLRREIDEQLYEDAQRVWRLFREIVEGLCHIHQQGIIHRDLKPVNIFIDNDDHVKIGDFGLATTSILHKQSRETVNAVDINEKIDINTFSSQTTNQTGDLSQTGQIGTAMYVAPELKSKSTKIPYTQKVDIFSLGIIFFEMCHPALITGMERYKILNDLRQEVPVFPNDFPHDLSSHQHSLIRWMLKHDTKERPSSQQLLQSQHIPPPELEEEKVRELVRHTISNPQSKDYKHLVASCFKQINSPAVNATFDLSSSRSGRFLLMLESVTDKLRKIFVRHGAISILTPLLSPAVEKAETCVCLMNRSGSIVYATYDLRTSFARYLAHNVNITHMKRYAIDKVYREKKVHGLHPKEMYECSFDIVTSSASDLMSEYEIFSVIWEILQEFPSLLRKNCTIHLNHSYFITAILKHCGLDQDKQKNICIEIYKHEYRSKSELEAYLKSLCLPDHNVSVLINLLDVEGTLDEIITFMLSIFKDIVSITLCKQAFRTLESVIDVCKILGITCNVVVTPGLMQNAHYFSGIMFQVVLDQRTKQKQVDQNIIISGGRYDNLLHFYRKSLAVVTEGSQGVVGLLLSLDKFTNALNDQETPAAVDVLVCSLGQNPITKDKLLFLLRDLWRSGIRTSFLSTTQSLEDIKTYCQEMNISNIVSLKDNEPGFARIATWTKERFQEKKVPCSELIENLLRLIKIGNCDTTQVKFETKMTSTAESCLIRFIDKPSHVVKRRYINQIGNYLSSTLQKFSKKFKIEIIALNLEEKVIKKLWNSYESENRDQELHLIREGYPRLKRYINLAVEEIEVIKKNNHSAIIILYSLTDNIFKVLL